MDIAGLEKAPGAQGQAEEFGQSDIFPAA